MKLSALGGPALAAASPLFFLFLLNPLAALAADFDCTYVGGSYVWTDVAAWSNCNSNYPDNSTSSDIFSALFTTGTLNLNQSIEVFNYTQSGSSTLTGTGDLLVTGLLDWSATSSSDSFILTSGTVTAAGGTALNGIASGYDMRLGSQATLINPTGQTANWIDGRIILDGTYNNETGATFNSTLASTDSISGNGTFNNAGTFNVTNNAFTAVSSGFNNTGTVDVQSGRLVLTGTGVHTGDFDGTGALLTFGGNQTFNGSQITGNTLAFSGTSTANVGSSVTADAVTFSSGTNTFESGASYTATTTTVSSGSTRFNAGASVNLTDVSVAGSGRLTLSDSTAHTLDSLTISGGGRLEGTSDILVTGLLDWSATSSSDSFILTSGTVTAAGGTALNGIASGYDMRLGSQATLINPTGQTANWIDGRIILDGTYNNETGATFNSTLASTDSISGNGTFNNAGTFNVTNNAFTAVSSGFNNTGTVDVQSGRLVLTGGLTQSGDVTIDNGATLNRSGTYDQSAGNTVVNGTLISSSSVSIFGGTMSGEGTVNANVLNAATLSAGDGVGEFQIDGSYTQNPFGELYVEIVDLTNFDVLSVANSANLDGTLRLGVSNSYSAVEGDTFDILLADLIAGAFTQVIASGGLGENLMWQVDYDLNSAGLDMVSLRVASVPVPAGFVLFASAIFSLAWVRKQSKIKKKYPQ